MKSDELCRLDQMRYMCHLISSFMKVGVEILTLWLKAAFIH